jgi:hypothetical protein
LKAVLLARLAGIQAVASVVVCKQTTLNTS